MSNVLAVDRVQFAEDPPDIAFNKAMQQGNEFLKNFPGSKFLIVFDSESGQVEIHYDKTSLRNHYVDLFGPGDVPGYLTEVDMEAIEYIVKKIPDSGHIVEIGSFLGKSAVEWAKNTKKNNKNYKIICIDSFNSQIEILKELLRTANFDIPELNSNLELFRHYTKAYDNIVPLEAFFDVNFQFDLKVDLVFEDSDHTQKTLSHALPFWWSRIKNGGILAGHDYTTREVKTSVDTFAITNGFTVNVFPGSSIWYIEKHA